MARTRIALVTLGSKRGRLRAAWLAGLLAVVVMTLSSTASAATIWGLKSKDQPAPSAAPTRLFSFSDDGTGFTAIGTVTLAGASIDADALAASPTLGLRAFQVGPAGAPTSRLISIDPTTAVATAIGSAHAGRDIRGAMFDRLDRLWALDAAANSLLRVDPATGAILSETALAIDLHDGTDLAEAADGMVYLVNHDTTINPPFGRPRFYTLDLETGALTPVFTDTANDPTGAFPVFVPGLAAGSGLSASTLFAYEANGFEDIFAYALPGFGRSAVFTNIISDFNAGRGDLAAFPPRAPTALVTYLALNSGGALKLLGWTDGTEFKVSRLSDGAQLGRGTLNRFQFQQIPLGSTTHFKVETTAPVLATLGFDCCSFGGSFFYPRVDGRSFVGRDFIVRIPVLNSNNEFIVFAWEPAAVTIRNTAGAVVTTTTLPQHGFFATVGAPLSSGGTFRIESTGDIAVTSNSRNAFTTVPSRQGTHVGTEFMFGTRSWEPSSFAFFGYEAAAVTVTNLETAAVVFSESLAPGQLRYVSGFGDNKFRVSSTGKIGVWGGSNEGGNSVSGMGDDLNLTAGDQGRDILVHTQSQGGTLFAFRDGTTVTVDGVPSALDRGQFLSLGAGALRRVVADRPVIVQTIGGNSLNDWEMALVPDTMFGPQLAVSVVDSPDPVRAGDTLTYTVTVTNDGAAPATDVVVSDPLPATVTFQSATSSQGTCGAAGALVQCQLGAIAADGSALVTIVVRTTVPATVENTPSVASAEGESASATATAIVLVPPAPPSGLVATISAGGRIRLTWTDGADNESGFQIERKSRGRFARIATVPADATTFEDVTAARGQAYTYRVRAINAAGTSAYSNEAAASLLVGKLTVRERALAFRARAGGQDTRQVFVRNTGAAPLDVTFSASGAAFAVVAGGAPVTLAPGASHAVTVRFTPASAGPATGSLTVSTVGPPAAALTVQLNGTAR